jgi:ribonuclease VapC
VIVLDSSCLLAIVFREPGLEKAVANLHNAVISSVNVVEVISRQADRGMDRALALANYRDFEVPSVPFDETLAILAGELREMTRHLGLSLGDRACLALAIRENATAVTADRKWADLEIGCKIEIIR